MKQETKIMQLLLINTLWQPLSNFAVFLIFIHIHLDSRQNGSGLFWKEIICQMWKDKLQPLSFLEEFGPWNIIIAENRSLACNNFIPQSLNTVQPVVAKTALGGNQAFFGIENPGKFHNDVCLKMLFLVTHCVIDTQCSINIQCSSIESCKFK